MRGIIHGLGEVYSTMAWFEVSLTPIVRRGGTQQGKKMWLLRGWTETLMVGIICMSLSLEGSSTMRHQIHKRMLPENQNCDPSKGTCSKGDFVDKTLADCRYEAKFELETCTVRGKTGGIISWVVAPDRDNRCKPIENGKRFSCGARGTNTRCVCSDHKIEFNDCRCQYWTEATPGIHDPAFCTAYYLAGESHVHHYACCNNCNDSSSSTTSLNWESCDNHTYEGGSSSHYCNSCGVSTGGGLVKYDFNCGNCRLQTHCEAECNEIIGLTLPGLCWKWVNCFRGCCVAKQKVMSARYSQKATIDLELKKRHSDRWIRDDNYAIVTNVEFCGDGNCSKDEDRFSCPADCCSLINNKCSSVPGVCTDDCCQLASCCLDWYNNTWI